MATSENFDRVLDQGLLTKKFLHLLSVSPQHLNRLCAAYGTQFCFNCPHTHLIPDSCPMRDDVFLSTIVPMIEGGIGKDKVSIYCCICDLECPCNRSLNFEEVARDLDRYAKDLVA